MGCLQSTNQDPATDAVAPQGTDSKPKQLHALVRPDIYKDKRPSFYSVYARAARRYGFETGQYAGFAKRGNVVVKVKSHADKDTEHEVPAESIQNGACRVLLPAFPMLMTPCSRVSRYLIIRAAYF